MRAFDGSIMVSLIVAGETVSGRLSDVLDMAARDALEGIAAEGRALRIGDG
jgi:hypothetical protein